MSVRSRWTALRCIAVSTAVAVGGGGLSPVYAAPCWPEPVRGRVVDPFREPPCPWCAGNRGIEYAVGADTAVISVATGVVTFAGVVAGTRYVVVEIADGWRLTYGRLASATPRRGDRVVSGTEIGRAADEFFFGVRIDGIHRDPAPFLGTLVGRWRLIPLAGDAPRPAPPPRLRC